MSVKLVIYTDKIRYSSEILMTPEWPRQNFDKYSDIKLNENPSSAS